jgi:hypothetical protein
MKWCSSSKAAQAAKPSQQQHASAGSTAAASFKKEHEIPCTVTDSYAFDPKRAANHAVSRVIITNLSESTSAIRLRQCEGLGVLHAVRNLPETKRL